MPYVRVSHTKKSVIFLCRPLVINIHLLYITMKTKTKGYVEPGGSFKPKV